MITWQTALAVASLAAMAWLCRSDDRRLAFAWGLLLPVDYLTGVPPGVFDVARYAGVAWLCWRARPTLPEPGRRAVLHLGAAIASVALVRGVFALPRADRNSLTFAVVMLASTACAAVLALRPRVHRAVAGGYLGGVVLSAAVSVMQALHLPTLRRGAEAAERYPGVSTYTMLLTWQLAFAIVLAVYLATRPSVDARARRAALVALPVLLLASVTNGAQGGFLGIAAAAGAVLWSQRGRLRWTALARWVAAGLVGVAVIAGFAVATRVDLPTIDGLRGEGGYRNEKARWKVAVDGLRELRDHPLVGVGRTHFMDRHVIAPHFLPIDSGVTAGILGFLVASYLLVHVLRLVWQGPADRRASTITGFALLAAMTANTLTESYGPFIGLSRVSVLFLALVAVKGFHPDPGDEETSDVEGARPEADAGSWGPARVLERLTGARPGSTVDA